MYLYNQFVRKEEKIENKRREGERERERMRDRERKTRN